MDYLPITKERAAEILSVSKRTIDNFLAEGRLPRPSHIGRRLYWHPDVFYRWLNAELGAPENGSVPATALESQTKRRGRPRKSGH